MCCRMRERNEEDIVGKHTFMTISINVDGQLAELIVSSTTAQCVMKGEVRGG